MGALNLVRNGTELVEGAFQIHGDRLLGSDPAFEEGHGERLAAVGWVGGTEHEDGKGNIWAVASTKDLLEYFISLRDIVERDACQVGGPVHVLGGRLADGAGPVVGVEGEAWGFGSL